ncbi:MAG: recombinase family protein [Candidatus Pacearchaeota archaeon]
MKCEKCGYSSEKNKKMFGSNLCEICYHLSPADKKSFREYINEKVSEHDLKGYRKYFHPGEKQKKGMIKKATKGNPMSRAPFGYEMVEGNLIPSDNYKEVGEIFEEFLEGDLSLRRIAEKHKFSVNGLKKILRNFAYIGKIKFNNQVFEGEHKPIISTTLFNHVQDKLEKLGTK